MKIGIAATGGSLDALVSERFGRCAFFLIVDSETMRFEAFSNPAGGNAGGAGPAAANELAKRGAEMLLAGEVGPKAQQALDAAGIRFVQASGPVREALSKLDS